MSDHEKAPARASNTEPGQGTNEAAPIAGIAGNGKLKVSIAELLADRETRKTLEWFAKTLANEIGKAIYRANLAVKLGHSYHDDGEVDQ